MAQSINRFLDQLDDTREARYNKTNRPQIRQFEGFRNEWALYFDQLVEDDNIDWN